MEAEALVADDDDFFRLAMAGILRNRHGFATVHEVASFEEASHVLASRAGLSFASFDLDMPGMSDVRQLRAVRLAYPAVKLAIVSGSFDRGLGLRALDAGVHGFIPKTAGAAQVGRAIGLVLAGEIYVPPGIADLSLDESHGVSGDARLTDRQRQVLDLIGEGATNKEIALRLGLGEGTVKIHVGGALKALGVGTREAAAAAMSRRRHGLARKP